MKIEKTISNNELTVHLIGRLDTTTAVELEDSLKESLDSVNDVIFDFNGLEYVSSAGLRILLTTSKIVSKRGKMVIKNVCEDIMDVFEMTGFTDILNIE